jgi:hypothetical protein
MKLHDNVCPKSQKMTTLPLRHDNDDVNDSIMRDGNCYIMVIAMRRMTQIILLLQSLEMKIFCFDVNDVPITAESEITMVNYLAQLKESWQG